MRSIEQNQPPLYFSSESELEMFIGETVAVAVIKNIIVDQSYRFKCPQRSGIEKDRCLFLKFFIIIYLIYSLHIC